ncbi:hypothetical protein ABPG72_007396 [Tetrahymena utriculariae]
MLIEEKDISNWRNDIQDYNKQRKERGYENPKVERISQKNIKDKEKIFDPLLQVYNDPSQDKDDLAKTQFKLQAAKTKKNKHIEKYQKDYDIVNLEKLDVQIIPEKTYTKSVIKPSVREYNIISNTPLEKYMYENVKVLKQEKVVEKKTDLSKTRDFNIITNKYTENHETKLQNDEENVKNKLDEKYRKTHKFNIVSGLLYDPEQEKAFQEQLKETNQSHGKNAILKLPPSLRYRETVIFDRNKPIPEELKLIDQQRENAKKRYKIRYAVENEYHERNLEMQDRRQQRLLNGLCDQKYLDEYKKGFDIITLDKIDIHDIEKLINKKPNLSSWDKVQMTKREDFGSTENGFAESSDIKYYNEGVIENVNQTPQNVRQQDYQSSQAQQDLRINEPGKISLPKIGNNYENDHEEIFGQQQKQSLRTVSNNQNTQEHYQQFSQTGDVYQSSKPQKQSRRRQSGQKAQQQFEENTFGATAPPKSSNKSEKAPSRGNIISSDSNQNKFRIKTGGFNS